MSQRLRADLLLVKRGLFDSRAKAQAAIAAGGVVAGGAVVKKASDTLPEDIVIVAEAAHPYVSRGGLKLAGALDHFGITVTGLSCLDVGSSTGGFSQVLLMRGAAAITAVDSGRDQFHASLRGEAAIRLLEGTDIRTLGPTDFESPPDLAVIDVSFISLDLVLPAVAALLAPAAEIVALIKPQFEVGRAHVGKGGIVKDDTARQEAVTRIAATLARLGFEPTAAIPSPIAGGDGNIEYLIAARRSKP